ncbi:unnamed protein product [Anisakis simplex]|uniref:Uncharacterized protein n=1 Tax=Anisakis simplex TaxID=6269 RepID=A0A0M3J7C4_ANISI|nr:unnamed protein product [Anisakis simplex]
MIFGTARTSFCLRDTPTFMPLVNSSSADCSQIHQMWNATATMLTENTSIFSSLESSPNKQFATMPTNSASNRNSILPPLPPRAADYVNIISPAKSVDNILLRSPPPPSFTSSAPRTTQTLGRPVPRPKILITRRPSQCPLLLQSPVRPPPLVPQSESLSNINYQMPYRDRHQNENELPQLHELNGYTLSNKLNQSPHRLIFSTEVSLSLQFWWIYAGLHR